MSETKTRMHPYMSEIMSVILMGDFGQLPPVGDKPMYVTGNGSVVIVTMVIVCI